MRLPCYCTALLCCTATSAMAAERSTDTRASAGDNAVTEPVRYYAIFFSHQDESNRIRSSHTFATFLRVSGRVDQPVLEASSTISWLPKSGLVSLARHAEPGLNHSLRQTLAAAEERGLEIKYWGPFEIREELFHCARRQEQRLNDHRYLYKVFDAPTRGAAKNCIHAVADMVQDLNLLDSGTARGHDATEMVVEHLRPYFSGPEPLQRTHATALFEVLRLNGSYLARDGGSLASR